MMLSPVLGCDMGSYLDLSPLFPEGIFAFVTLRDFPAGVGAEALGTFLRGRGLGSIPVAVVKQVHSGRVVEASEAPCEADGIVVRERGRGARVVAADCVPVLLARKDGTACAAVHAGWKGTLAGIAARAAERLSMDGEGALMAYIGPAIGACCYDVPEDRRRLFQEAWPGWSDPDLGPPGRLDLQALNRRTLIERGVRPKDILVEECCTACSPALCWSYRRDGASAGRMAALVGRFGADPAAPGPPSAGGGR